MKRRKPEEVAKHYISCGQDPDWIQQKWVNKEKGRGVVATRDITRGEFIAEYEGHLITEEELERREEQIESVFRYEFTWKGKKLCMDASEENSRLGRLLNHAETNAERNCRVKVIAIQNVPHLCIFSISWIIWWCISPWTSFSS